MHPRRFAMIAGAIMLVLGIAAFIPALSTYSADSLRPLELNTSHGLFLGFLAFNVVNKVALIGFGLAGIWAASREAVALPRSITWARAVALVMGLGAVLGLIPATSTFFGYWPLYGADVVVHAVFALTGAYFGYALSSKVPERGPTREQAKREIYGR